MDVKLREGKHYRWHSSARFYAVSKHKKGFITFGRKWLLPLSERGRCAVLIHELWHAKNLDRAMKGRQRIRIAFVASALPGILLFAYLITRIPPHPAPAVVLVGGLFFAALGMVIWAAVWRMIGGMLYRRFACPIEFECDEAAVRFIGSAGTIEYLKALKSRSNHESHPPTKLRRERIAGFVTRYPVPEIVFSALQAEIPQVFDPHVD